MEYWGYSGTELDPPILVYVINYPESRNIYGGGIGIKCLISFCQQR
jgi:hypothetical protein